MKEQERIELQAKATRKAEIHWIWLEKLLGHIFIDAFVHGYKHGKEEYENDREEKS